MSYAPLERRTVALSNLSEMRPVLPHHEKVTPTPVPQPASIHIRPVRGFGPDHLMVPGQALHISGPKMPIMSSQIRESDRNSRIDASTSLMSGRPVLHQRVHDADDARFHKDPNKRFGRSYDPNQSVAWQTGILERERDRRNPKRELVRQAAGEEAEAEAEELMRGDVLRMVIRITNAASALKKRRKKKSGFGGGVPPEVMAELRHLMRTTGTIMIRQHALPEKSNRYHRGPDTGQGDGGKQRPRQQLPKARPVKRKR